jgi:hypothetical protein
MGKRKRSNNPPTQAGKGNFPFAPGYLRSLLAATDDDREASKREVCSTLSQPDKNSEKCVETSGSFAGSCISKFTPKKSWKFFIDSERSNRVVIVAIPGLTLYVSGVCLLTPLWGTASANGSKLKVGRPTRFMAPVWTPSIRLHFSASTRGSANLEQIFESIKFTASKHPAMEGIFECVFLVEAIDPEEMEWILAAEDYSLFATAETNHSSLGTNCAGASDLERAEQGLRLKSAAIGDASFIKSLRIDTTLIPKSWVSSCNKILETPNQTKTVIYGPKGVGKYVFIQLMYENKI